MKILIELTSSILLGVVIGVAILLLLCMTGCGSLTNVAAEYGDAKIEIKSKSSEMVKKISKLQGELASCQAMLHEMRAPKLEPKLEKKNDFFTEIFK